MNVFIQYVDMVYGLELKSFSSQWTAGYGQSLGHAQMWLVLFVDEVDEVDEAESQKI